MGLAPEALLARFRTARDQLRARIAVLAAVLDVPAGPRPAEFHLSRAGDLAARARVYTWLLGAPPKEWIHRYAAFLHPELHTNFVLVVADGGGPHHDTLAHLGVGVGVDVDDRAAGAYELARVAGWTGHEPPRTTWRGTPLHELCLLDPDGNFVEVYARLTDGSWPSGPPISSPRRWRSERIGVSWRGRRAGRRRRAGG